MILLKLIFHSLNWCYVGKKIIFFCNSPLHIWHQKDNWANDVRPTPALLSVGDLIHYSTEAHA